LIIIWITENFSRFNTQEEKMANHIRKQVLSMRGQPVDFSSLEQQNQNQQAIGNANLNVRGDLLGSGGVVLKTQEQIQAEWARKSSQMITENVSIKSDTVLPKPSSLSSDTMPVASTDETVSSVDDASFQTLDQLVSSGVVTPKKKAEKND